MARYLRLLWLSAAVLTLPACNLLQTMPDAKPGKLAADKVIVVGKFVVNPPMHQLEKEAGKDARIIGEERYLNKVFFATAATPMKKGDDPRSGWYWKNSLDARWGETYFKQADAKKTYLNVGTLYLDAVGANRVWLPGGFSFTPPANAKAVYIGTIKFTRDDFWNITKVKVVDEYKAANREFSKKFGNSIALKKVLLR